VDDKFIAMAGTKIQWETIQGNHRVGEGGIPYYSGYNQRIKLGLR
jgi:hypothetical protein